VLTHTQLAFLQLAVLLASSLLLVFKHLLVVVVSSLLQDLDGRDKVLEAEVKTV